MRAIRTIPFLSITALAAVLVIVPRTGRADVTIQQQTQFDLAIIKAHGTRTEFTTTDKRRSDSDMHCEGFMSMFCGNTQSGEIIRLDRDLEWWLEPKKMEYRETPLPTAAQLAAAKQEAAAMMEKIKQCPAVTQQSGPDTSKCEMSPPRFDVKQPGTHAMLAGHDSQLTQIALTQSCTNKTTGEVCDFLFAFDTWLTQDQIAGLADQKTFLNAYHAKLGLDPNDPAVQKQMRQFLAPYADAMKQVSAKSGELKGYPLKTVLRIAFGGEHCSTSKNQTAAAGGGGSGNVLGDASQAAGNAAAASTTNAASSAAGTAAANAAKNPLAGSVFSSAASAFGSKLAGGLFNKKKAETPAAATPAASPDNALPSGMVQAAQISVETTSINDATVPADKFEIPAGWKRVEPKPTKETGPKEFTCPTAGS
jgi:hypothetical protein